jgi:glycine cleavage system H protein
MKFTKDHEWVKVENDIATIGITEHAAEALGELVYIELPKIGAKFNKGDAAVVVESSKSASDVYSPVSGEVIATNESLIASPENVNQSAYEKGWLIKVKIANIADLESCMNEADYQDYLKESH